MEKINVDRENEFTPGAVRILAFSLILSIFGGYEAIIVGKLSHATFPEFAGKDFFEFRNTLGTVVAWL